MSQGSSQTYLMDNMKHCASRVTKSQQEIDLCRVSQHTQRENKPAVGRMGSPVASTVISSSVSSPPRTISSSAKKPGWPIRKRSRKSYSERVMSVRDVPARDRRPTVGTVCRGAQFATAVLIAANAAVNAAGQNNRTTWCCRVRRMPALGRSKHRRWRAGPGRKGIGDGIQH